MLIHSPLDLPNIYPDSWDTFWNIWNKHAKVLYKKKVNHTDSKSPVGSTDLWVGLDIMLRYGSVAHEAPYYDIKNDLPKFYEGLMSLPIPVIKRIRIVQSLTNIESHSDNNIDKWEIRGMLHYPAQNQWYYTKPNDTTRHYMTMPNDTMWFTYNDLHCWHGSDFDSNNKKLLIQINYMGDISKLISCGADKYKKHCINI